MRTHYWIILLVLAFSQSVRGQLSSQHYHLRSGDELIKQQVEFIEPGEPGANKVRIEVINICFCQNSLKNNN